MITYYDVNNGPLAGFFNECYRSWITTSNDTCINDILKMNQEELNEKAKEIINNNDFKEEHNMSGRYPWKSEKKEEKNPLAVEIKKIVIHNDKVMIVYFLDGTFTKAVCSDSDTFSFDAGFQVCLLKKLYGDKNYHNLMRKTRKFYDVQQEFKKVQIEEKKNRREEQERRHQKNLAKRNKVREEFKEDIAAAVKGVLMVSGKADDDRK